MRILIVAAALVACASPTTQPKPAAPTATASPPPSARPEASGDRALEPPMPTLRLPRNFVPTSYAATLAIDPAQSGFDGTIAITGGVAERSQVIWLHGRHLTVKHAVAQGTLGSVELTATPHGEDLLEFRAKTPLDTGTWTLAIDYSGKYDEVNTTGAFKQTIAGSPYIYTQFEALYARWVFPCLDEPDNKVPWKLTLDVPAQLVAVSNTPIARETAMGDHKRVEFATTKPLPSYLVAFGVGPFDVVDAGRTRSGAPVRIIAMKDRAPEMAWAAKTTPRIVDLLEDLFGSPYPYEKLDMLAIPVTVGFGAMENAGLITFTETLMLLDPKHAGRGREYAWVDVAAHELAHQWFGDLVTTAWWDDIWLNEGFANWIEHKISARFEPGWHDELSEITGRNTALDNDKLVSARQIRQPIVKVDDIENAFDNITYDKGASVLNMFEGYVGSDVFMKGVREYIKEHAWHNATSTDFARAISKAAGRDVGPAFATFLEQPGAPEITANLVCDAGQPPKIALEQQRYVPPGSPVPAAGKPWIVPVCVAFERGGKRAEACTMLEDTAGSIELDTRTCPRWMMPNVDGRGYYRNAYTQAQVAMLRDEAWPQLKPTERRVVTYDVVDAAMLGKLPFRTALSFTPRLLAAGDRFSIDAALDLPVNAQFYVPTELRPAYEAALRRTFSQAAHKAGLSPRDDDTLDVEAVRNKLAHVVGNVGRDPALVAEAIKLSDKWRDLPPAVRGEVVAIAAHASPVVFDRLLKQVATEPDRARREEIVYALASTSDAKQQRAALALMLDPAVDIRDTQYMLFAAADEEGPRAVARQFFLDNKDALLKRVPAAGTTSGHAVFAYLFAKTCDAEKRDEIVSYVSSTFATMEGGGRVAKQAIEALDHCIARRKLIEPEIRSWLAGGGSAAGVRARQ